MASRCHPRSYATYKGEGGQLRRDPAPRQGHEVVFSDSAPPSPHVVKTKEGHTRAVFYLSIRDSSSGISPSHGTSPWGHLSTCPPAVCPGSTSKTEFFASVSSPEWIPAPGSLAGDPATDVDPAQAALHHSHTCHSHGPSPNSDPEPQPCRPRV